MYRWVKFDEADKPPLKVIVTEHCTATASATSTANERYGSPSQPTVAASNGLGSTVVTSGGLSGTSWTVTKVSNGTRTRVINGGNTLTITCAVNASSSADAPQYGYANADAEVYHTVTQIIPVEILLSDGKDSSRGRKYLIGQRLTAFMSPALANPTWSVSGGSYFKSYTRSQNLGLVHMMEPVDFLQSSLECCFKEATATKITVSGTYTNQFGESFSVSAEEDASVEIPVIEHDQLYIGLPQVVGVYPPHMKLVSTDSVPGGIKWEAIVKTPDEFSGVGGDPRNTIDHGVFAFTQTVVPNRTYLDAFGNTGNCLPTVSGVTYLDGANPNYTNITTIANGRESDTFDDSPSEPLKPPRISVQVADQFWVDLMYLPPGYDSQWVSLKRRNWSWGGTADLNDGTWTLTGGFATAGGTSDYLWQPNWTESLVLSSE